jgi:hypothetical protein
MGPGVRRDDVETLVPHNTLRTSVGFKFQTTLFVDTTSRSRGAFRPGFAGNVPPSPIRGRREAGRPMRPIAACAMSVVERTRVSQVTPESPGTPRAMVLTAYIVLSPATGLFCHRRPRKLPFANLTPASGRQDHTFLPYASAPFVIGASASTASRPASVTIANRPSEWGGTATHIARFGFRKNRNIFANGTGQPKSD